MKVRSCYLENSQALWCALIGRQIIRENARLSERGEAQGIEMLACFTLIAC